MSKAWVVRTGKYGERDSWALENGYAGGGWHGIPDLTGVTSKTEIERIVRDWGGAGAKETAIPNYVGQLWALRERIQPGDLMVLPLKTTSEIAIGVVIEGYKYLGDEEDDGKRHVVTVDWKVTDLARTQVKQDLLFTLGSALTVFSPVRNRAVERLTHLMENGVDPGVTGLGESRGEAVSSSDAVPETMSGMVDEPEDSPDIEQNARDQIQTRITEDFAGHAFAELVNSVLEAEGFHTESSPPGPDGGVDIVAGSGMLGLESPRIVVQVKTGQVGSPVVSQIMGLVAGNSADHGLIVTWTGLSSEAKNTVKNNRFGIKVWGPDDVIDAVLRNYEQLPAEFRSKLPLKRVWVLDDSAQ